MNTLPKRPTRAPAIETRAEGRTARSKTAGDFNALAFHEAQVGPRSIFLYFLKSEDRASGTLAAEIDEAMDSELDLDNPAGTVPYFGRGASIRVGDFRNEKAFVALIARIARACRLQGIPADVFTETNARALWSAYQMWRAHHA